MQLINCKISYLLGDEKIYTTELKNTEYTIEINNSQNTLKANINTTSTIQDLKIEFYVKVPTIYKKYYTNGFQTWLKSNEFSENKKTSNFLNKLAGIIEKGSGFDYACGLGTNDNLNSSYGYCYFKCSDKDKILIFASLDEKSTFCKYNFDFERCVLKITRDFNGYSINKNQEIANIVSIEDNFAQAFSILQNYLEIPKEIFKTKKLVGYNTFSEYKNQINEKIISNKIHALENCYDFFMVGDGYSQKGYDILSLDNKRFPSGLKRIVEKIHEKEIKAAIWIAPFAISPFSKNFANLQNLVLKQNDKAITTCPFWGGSYSLDITNSNAEEYLKNIFNLVCNEWGFDIVFCDCMFMAGALPTENQTQAMLLNKALELTRKFTQGKTLILGGVPFLSAINFCDYIAISPDSSNLWFYPLDIFTPQFEKGTKNNLQSLVFKCHQNLIYPTAYTVPSCANLKTKLLKMVSNKTDCTIIAEKQLNEINKLQALSSE